MASAFVQESTEKFPSKHFLTQERYKDRDIVKHYYYKICQVLVKETKLVDVLTEIFTDYINNQTEVFAGLKLDSKS